MNNAIFLIIHFFFLLLFKQALTKINYISALKSFT